jgi:hypothetical protein
METQLSFVDTTPEKPNATATRARVDRDALLILLLAGRPVSECAAELGVSRQTVWRTTNLPAFQSKLTQAREAALAGAVNALHSGATAFVRALAEVAADTKARPGERAQAARSGLDSLSKLAELFDVERRITKLEQAR